MTCSFSKTLLRKFINKKEKSSKKEKKHKLRITKHTAAEVVGAWEATATLRKNTGLDPFADLSSKLACVGDPHHEWRSTGIINPRPPDRIYKK